MRSWLKTIKMTFLPLLLSPLLMGVATCGNVFEGTADKESDDALLYASRLQINERDYSGALATLAMMSPEGLSSHDGLVTKATAQAGLCGLDLIGLAEQVSSGIATQKLFQLLLGSFRNTASATAWQGCKDAETTMKLLPNGSWTVDDYIFMAFTEFAKIGTILGGASGADANDDGSVDGTFDSCTNNASHIEDAKVQELGTGLTIAIASIKAAGSSIGGGVTGDFDGACVELDSVSPGFCNQTNTSDFDANEVKALRALIKSNEVGFDTCGGGVGSSLACSCL